MKNDVFVLSLIILSVSVLSTFGDLPPPAGIRVRKIDSNHAIEGQYILVFKSNATKVQRSEYLTDLFQSSVEDSFDSQIVHAFSFGGYHGFTAKLSEKMLKAQLKSPLIEMIEQDARIYAYKRGKSNKRSVKRTTFSAIAVNNEDEEQEESHSNVEYAGDSQNIIEEVYGKPKPKPTNPTSPSNSTVNESDTCAIQNDATWGLNRISEVDINLDGVYRYGPSAGAGVDAYIIDTGINTDHVDFGGRAIWGANFADNKNTDCNGHGTHVAGTVGSNTYGIAKKSTLIAVKVLDCSGSGSYSGVIAGINWVISSKGSRKNPSVANLSLGGPKSATLDLAITKAIEAGVSVVVAAGNDNKDACMYSPAGIPAAIKAGATGIDTSEKPLVDNRAYFSNFGPCVTLFAPGLMITSTWIGTNNNEVEIISGTSMASPHIAGAAALILGQYPNASPASVKNTLVNASTKNIVRLDCPTSFASKQCKKSPNAFLYTPCISAISSESVATPTSSTTSSTSSTITRKKKIIN